MAPPKVLAGKEMLKMKEPPGMSMKTKARVTICHVIEQAFCRNFTDFAVIQGETSVPQAYLEGPRPLGIHGGRAAELQNRTTLLAGCCSGELTSPNGGVPMGSGQVPQPLHQIDPLPGRPWKLERCIGNGKRWTRKLTHHRFARALDCLAATTSHRQRNPWHGLPIARHGGRRTRAAPPLARSLVSVYPKASAWKLLLSA